MYEKFCIKFNRPNYNIRQYTLSTFCCYAFLTAMTTRKQILLSEMKMKSYYAFREFKKFIQEDLDILIPIT
jgi:hypothetical protein